MMRMRPFLFGKAGRAVRTLQAKWLPTDLSLKSHADLIDVDFDNVSYADVLRAPCRRDESVTES